MCTDPPSIIKRIDNDCAASGDEENFEKKNIVTKCVWMSQSCEKTRTEREKR